jgi:hypothetical protein
VCQSACLLVQNFAKIQRNVFIEREYSFEIFSFFLRKFPFLKNIFLGPHLDSNFSLVAFLKTSFKTILTGSKNFSSFNVSSFWDVSQ